MSERRSVTREDLAAALWDGPYRDGWRVKDIDGVTDLPPNMVADAIFDALPGQALAAIDSEATIKSLELVGMMAAEAVAAEYARLEEDADKP